MSVGKALGMSFTSNRAIGNVRRKSRERQKQLSRELRERAQPHDLD